MCSQWTFSAPTLSEAISSGAGSDSSDAVQPLTVFSPYMHDTFKNWALKCTGKTDCIGERTVRGSQSPVSVCKAVKARIKAFCKNIHHVLRGVLATLTVFDLSSCGRCTETVRAEHLLGCINIRSLSHRMTTRTLGFQLVTIGFHLCKLSLEHTSAWFPGAEQLLSLAS